MRNKQMRYMFEERLYDFASSREVERIRTGKPPDRGKTRAKKKKATPEQIKRQNEYNRQKHVRRLIKANFGENDYWITLTYKKGHTLEWEQALKDRSKFLKALRAYYARQGYSLKWIGRIERGTRGAVHHHMILERIPGADVEIAKAWKKIKDAGHTSMKLLYEEGQYKELAAYITKPDELDKNGNLKVKSDFSHSRGNLKVPEPEIHRTTRKKILEEPKPTPGYYIDKDSVCQGINPVTGREYLHYIEIRIKEGGG